jgi:predicted RNA-binding protein with EMAP domain
MEFYTIGVYNSTEVDFFNKLLANGIDTFCDIRQRRGVRGSKYAFVNSNKLQIKLKELELNYIYIKELAPSQEIRELQKDADKKNNELKRDRQNLGDVFCINYTNKILSEFNFQHFITTLHNLQAKKIILFCVEEKPSACHRSLVSNKLKNEFNFLTHHL